MFGLWFAFMAAALALEPVPMPDPLPNDCARSYAIEYGKPIPFDIAGPDGVAKCSGILEPSASFAYLLAVETRAETADRLYAVDVSILETERDWYREQLESQQDQKWYRRPESQRWFGRLEILAIVGVVAVGMGAAYNHAK